MSEQIEMKHYCRWLATDKGKRTKCWQMGETIKKSECSPCLLARLVQATTNNKARKKAEWGKG